MRELLDITRANGELVKGYSLSIGGEAKSSGTAYVDGVDDVGVVFRSVSNGRVHGVTWSALCDVVFHFAK